MNLKYFVLRALGSCIISNNLTVSVLCFQLYDEYSDKYKRNRGYLEVTKLII